MYELFVIVAVVLAAAVVIITLKSKASAARAAYPYAKRETLLTAAEQEFLSVLEQAVSKQCRVYAQVRLADLMVVKSGVERANRLAAQNRINAKHADFVLCDVASLRILCAIELDDSSHQRPARKARDAFFEQACLAAGLPLVRFPVRKTYSVAAVRVAIFDKIDLSSTAYKSSVLPKAIDQLAASTKAPACPVCGSATVLRTVKVGVRAGNKLWGCRDYPACKGLIPV